MSNYTKIILPVLLLLIGQLVPTIVLANYLTLPVDVDPENDITAWFDHDGDDSTSMTKYTGEVFFGEAAATSTCSNPYDGSGCYDEHNGTDFSAQTGTDIKAPYDGTVEDVWWNNCAGWQTHLWHSHIGLSTLYSHQSATTTDISVSRGDKIGEVGSTGSCTTGAHLHFGVTDGYATSTSHRIDPFGWWDSENDDPWSYNKGYLWTTDPPSFDLYSTVSGNITASTTWRGNFLFDTSRTLNSGVVLNITPGTVVKFSGGTTKLTVQGTLNATGTSALPVYFTSYKDDVGGDWNGDGTSTSPAAGDWHDIRINGGTANLDNTVIRYGGYTTGGSQSLANLLNYGGGILNVSNSTIASSTSYGVYVLDGITSISTSTINANGNYGIFLYDGNSTTTVSNSTFSNHSSGAARLLFSSPYSDIFTASGNIATGNGPKGFAVEGTLGNSQTWLKDLPYIVSGTFTIPSGKMLTLAAGSILKFGSPSKLEVSGSLFAQGTSTDRVYFTSLKDDTVGGDTNNDGSGTTPAAGDWCGISSNTNASTTISFGDIRYGGNVFNFNCNGNAIRSNIINIFGIVNLLNTRISTSTTHGAYSFGTTTIANSEIFNNPTGIRTGTSISQTIFDNNIYGNTSHGLNNDSGSSITAENNYWGHSSGPTHASNPGGSGDTVSNNVDFNPWLSSWP